MGSTNKQGPDSCNSDLWVDSSFLRRRKVCFSYFQSEKHWGQVKFSSIQWGWTPNLPVPERLCGKAPGAWTLIQNLLMTQVTLSKSLLILCFLLNCPSVCRVEEIFSGQRGGPGVFQRTRCPTGAKLTAIWMFLQVFLSVSGSWVMGSTLSRSSVFNSTRKRHLFSFPGAETLDNCSVSSLKAAFFITLRWSGAPNRNFRFICLDSSRIRLQVRGLLRRLPVIRGHFSQNAGISKPARLLWAYSRKQRLPGLCLGVSFRLRGSLSSHKP